MRELILRHIFLFARCGLSILVALAAPAMAQTLSLDTENESLQKVLIEVNEKLPGVIRSALEKNKIKLVVQDIQNKVTSQPDSKFGHTDQDKEHKTVGRYSSRHKQITLSRSVLSNHELTVKTLIHELSHAYDYLNIQDAKVSQEQLRCMYLDREATDTEKHSCAAILKLKTTVSSQEAFLDAAGFWNLEFPRLVERERMNFLESRSPDRYEWTRPEETFAVNMEYFLTDPEYKCRRPSMYRALSKSLQNHIPFANIDCQSSNPTTSSWSSTVFLSGNPTAGTPSRFVKIDPRRVYAIHYLFAGQGSENMSRFGHAMYRIVICAPEHQVGPECLKDIGHHIVATFRASVEDLNLDTMAGLRGDYPSILFFVSLGSVLTDYNKKELRELRSLPLNLSPQEISSVLMQMTETQWTYEGKYKFFSNNCAVESLRLLRFALPEKNALQSIETVRPDNLYSEFLRIGLADDSVFNDLTLARTEGYYFPSKKGHYELAIQTLMELKILNISLNSNNKTSNTSKENLISTYLSMEPQTREQMIQQAVQLPTTPTTAPAPKSAAKTSVKSTDKDRALAALLVLEDYRILKMKSSAYSQLLGELIPLLSHPDEIKESSKLIDKENVLKFSNEYQRIKQLMTLFRSPAHLLDEKAKYGIPSQHEIEQVQSNPAVVLAMQSLVEVQMHAEELVQNSLKSRGQLNEIKTADEQFRKIFEEFKKGMSSPGLTKN